MFDEFKVESNWRCMSETQGVPEAGMNAWLSAAADALTGGELKWQE